MENKLLILNMKMYMELAEIKKYIEQVNIQNDNVIICPTAIYLPYFVNKYKNIAVQNIYSVNKGPYTGAISALQVKKMGVNYAVIGHSECRKYFNESDELINEKIKSAIDNELKVILCIGENLEDKLKGKTKEVLKTQIDVALQDVVNDDIIIAYEPIFSIGTGKLLSDDEINNTIKFIKEYLRTKNYNFKVIYGGSVNSKNIKSLCKIKEVDGFMVGKSSSMIDEVLEMVKVVSS